MANTQATKADNTAHSGSQTRYAGPPPPTARNTALAIAEWRLGSDFIPFLCKEFHLNLNFSNSTSSAAGLLRHGW